MSEENDDKQFEPTQKKLDDARKKGEVARSQDLNTAAAYTGFAVIGIAFGAGSLRALGEELSGLIAHSATLSTDMFSGGSGAITGHLLMTVFAFIAPWIVIPAMFALVSIIAQRSFVVAPDKLTPKLQRIDPMANAKNKFGPSGLFEFFKSFVKLVMLSIALGMYLWRELPAILGALQASPAMATVLLLQMSLNFLLLALVLNYVIGAIDFFWQRYQHLKKNRMSRKEMTDESKESEGDPHFKQHRRQRGYDIAMNQMLADVPGADVVVVNPTHYAVALKWSRLPGEAPVCVAKGVDEVAAKIREVASEAGVPIHSDPPTARAMFATVEIGEEIRPEHYKPIAAAIRFAEAMRQKARKSLFGGSST